MQLLIMTDSRLTSPERMENKTQTPVTVFQEISKTLTDEQILAENYIISKSITNITLKKYARMTKKNAVKTIIFVILSMIIYGCVTINVNLNQKPVEKKEVVIDTMDCNSRWLFQF